MARIDWDAIVARAALAREPDDFSRVWAACLAFGAGFVFGFAIGWCTL